MADEQQDTPESPKSRLGSRARVKQDSEAFARAGLRLLRFREETKAKTRLERLTIGRTALQLQIAKSKALEELWISHEQWERETGRENIAKGNPYARSVMMPDELQQAQEEARLKYERIFSRIAGREQDRSGHASRKVVRPAPVAPSRLKLWWAKWGGLLIFLAIIAALILFAPAEWFDDDGPEYIPTYGG